MNIKDSRGFSLLELIVSMSIFTIAVFIVMTTLLSIVNAQKKAIAQQNAQDNLRFAFESMTKEIRTGRKFHCGLSLADVATTPQNCPFGAGGVSFTFQNSVGQTVTYQVWTDPSSGAKQLVKSSDGAQPCTTGAYINCQKVTSPEVVIVNKVNFYVSGTAANDGLQSFATIALDGQVNDVQNIGTAKLFLQASISKRGLLDRP